MANNPTTTHALTFTDPPGDARRSRTDWDTIADQLRGRPGEWAIVRTEGGHSVTAHYIKTGRLAAFRPAGAFDAVTRSTAAANGKRTYTTYAQFIAEADTEAVPA